jgi:predicted CXXCH cytochrome family protein
MSDVRIRLVAVVVLLLPAAAAAKGGAYRSTKHGDARTGVLRLPDQAPGECTQCHNAHPAQGQRFGLFAADDNRLCATCHNQPGAAGSYPGSLRYEQSAHATSSGMTWPGPDPRARGSSDAGKCVNCHDPHGVRDARGVIASMLVAREENACLPCHDGSRARDRVAGDVRKPYRHPVALSGRHLASEGNDPARFAAGPVDARHAECVDCHNPHVGRAQPVPPQPPDAAEDLTGVGRVRVTNGAAGVPPLYTFAPADDLGPAREYEICFKCHSSWTRQPRGQADLAMLLNPANPSFHPIEAVGRNRSIRPAAFVAGWSWDRLIFCGDCHGSDDDGARGPHGSIYKGLLRRSYSTGSPTQESAPTDLCFSCHAYAAYADAGAVGPSQTASRFAGAHGHTFHVGSKRVPCAACHDAHGSARYPALLAVGRLPGLTAFVPDPGGGTCLSTCHAAQRYTLGYPR